MRRTLGLILGGLILIAVAARLSAPAAPPPLEQPLDQPRERLTIETGMKFLHAVDLSADGQLLVTNGIGPEFGMTRLEAWDALTGKRKLQIKDRYGTLAVSPDGKLIAHSQDDVVLLDPTKGETVAKLSDERHIRLAFSRDGRRLVGSGLEGLRVWDVATRREEAKFGVIVGALAFSPDGRTLASPGEGDPQKRDQPDPLTLWDVATGKRQRDLIGQPGEWRGLAFSADGRNVAGICYERTVHLWDIESGKVRLNLRVSKTAKYAGALDVAFSPDGKTLATADGATVKLWSTADGSERANLSEPATPFRVMFSRDGRTLVAAGISGGTVKVWDLK